MADFRPLIVALILTGLVAIGVINFGIMLANTNQASQSIADNSQLASYANDLNDSLTDAYSDAEEANTAISNSSLTLTSGFPIVEAIGGIWKTMKAVPKTIWDLTIALLNSSILGSPALSIFIGGLGAILIITIVLAVWKLISTGESG